MRQLTLEGITTNFKSLTISKVVHLALMNSIFTEIIDFLKQNTKMFPIEKYQTKD